MCLIFEVDQPTQRIRGLATTRGDLLQKVFGFMMILAARSTTEGFAASCIRSSDSGENSQRCSHTDEIRIRFVFDEISGLQEPLGT